MTIAQLIAAADYPDVWVKHGLASGEFFEQQARLFFAEYASQKPTGGTEHWRYGGFLYWLRQELTHERLQHLLEATIADPDPPMAGNVIKAVLSHSQATKELLASAVRVVSRKAGYYVTAQELEQLFSTSRRPGSNAA